MKVDVNVDINFPQFDEPILSILALLRQIDYTTKATLQGVKKLEMTVQEAIQVLADENVKLDDIAAKLTEGFEEIIKLIGELQNTNLTPEQEAIVTALQGKVDAVQPQAQQIADIVPGP